MKTTLNRYEHDSSCSNLHGIEKVVDPSNFLPLWHKAPKKEEKKKNQHTLLILLDVLLFTIIIIVVVEGGRRGHHRPPLVMSGRSVALMPGAPPHGLQGGAQPHVRVKLWLLLLLLLLISL